MTQNALPQSGTDKGKVLTSGEGLVWKRCGHPRTPENTMGGRIPHCRECRNARDMAVKDVTRAKREAIVDDFLEGIEEAILCVKYGVGAAHIRRVINGDPRISPPARDPFLGKRAIAAAAKAVGASPEQLFLDWRNKPLVQARWAAMRAMDRAGYSYSQIGRIIKRDHSTIIYGLRRAEYAFQHDPEFAQLCVRVAAS